MGFTAKMDEFSDIPPANFQPLVREYCQAWGKGHDGWANNVIGRVEDLGKTKEEFLFWVKDELRRSQWIPPAKYNMKSMKSYFRQYYSGTELTFRAFWRSGILPRLHDILLFFTY